MNIANINNFSIVGSCNELKTDVEGIKLDHVILEKEIRSNNFYIKEIKEELGKLRREFEQMRQQFEYSSTHRQASSSTNKGNQTVSDVLCVDSQDTVIFVNDKAETEQARQQFEFSHTHRQASSSTNNGNKSLDGAKNQSLAEISSQLQDYRNKQRKNHNLLNRLPLQHPRKKITTAEEPGANKPNVRMSR